MISSSSTLMPMSFFLDLIRIKVWFRRRWQSRSINKGVYKHKEFDAFASDLLDVNECDETQVHLKVVQMGQTLNWPYSRKVGRNRCCHNKFSLQNINCITNIKLFKRLPGTQIVGFKWSNLFSSRIFSTQHS